MRHKLFECSHRYYLSPENHYLKCFSINICFKLVPGSYLAVHPQASAVNQGSYQLPLPTGLFQHLPLPS